VSSIPMVAEGGPFGYHRAVSFPPALAEGDKPPLHFPVANSHRCLGTLLINEVKSAGWAPGTVMKYGVCRGAEPLCRESEGVPQI
jgi:hypothetical protein